MLSADAYRLGHGLIDSEHNLLFGLITELESRVREKDGHTILADLMERLYSYAALHFSTEDRLMAETNYPEIDNHRAEHESVLVGLRRLEATFQSGGATAAEDTLQFMMLWVTNHIPNSDRKLADHLWQRRRQ